MTLNCYNDAGQQIGSVTGKLPQTGAWVNAILRFHGTGHGDGNGGDVDLILDADLSGKTVLANQNKFDLFTTKQSNVFTTKSNVLVDEERIYNVDYDDASICKVVFDASWNSSDHVCSGIGLPVMDLAADGDAVNTGIAQSAVTFSQGNALWETGKIGGALHLQPSPVGAQLSGYFGAGQSALSAYPGHTITLWFKDNTGTSADLLFSTMSDRGIRASASGGKLTVVAGTPSSPSMSAAYSVGAWHQLVVTDTQHQTAAGAWVTDTVDVYLDGSIQGSLPINGTLNVWVGTSSVYYAGSNSSTSTSDIVVDEFKIWNANLVNMTNVNGQQEPLCVMAFGGLFDQSSGDCKLP
jgi:hypothetical protein